jgi:hypothetical protein
VTHFNNDDEVTINGVVNHHHDVIVINDFYLKPFDGRISKLKQLESALPDHTNYPQDPLASILADPCFTARIVHYLLLALPHLTRLAVTIRPLLLRLD